MEVSMLIIIHDDTGFFWTGSGWSAEYPDAKLYKSMAQAKAAANLRTTPTSNVRIMKNYGYENEEMTIVVHSEQLSAARQESARRMVDEIIRQSRSA